MLKKGQEDLVEKHHQLTDGKNLAILRYRQGVKEPACKEEEESSVWEGTDSVTTSLGKKMKSTTMEQMREEVETSAQTSKPVVSPKSHKYRHKKIIIVKARKHHQQ